MFYVLGVSGNISVMSHHAPLSTPYNAGCSNNNFWNNPDSNVGGASSNAKNSKDIIKVCFCHGQVSPFRTTSVVESGCVKDPQGCKTAEFRKLH